MTPVEERDVLASIRQELEATRTELARKSARYRVVKIVGTVVGCLLIAGMAVMAAGIWQVHSSTRSVEASVAAINGRSVANKQLLDYMTSLLADVESVTNPSARVAQDAATAKLVQGLVCQIYLGLAHSDPTLTLPAGCHA